MSKATEAINEAVAQSGDTLATNISTRTALGWAEAYGVSGTHYVYLSRQDRVMRYPAVALPKPLPAAPKTFSVWNGNTINHANAGEIAAQVAGICPDPAWALEWFPKAGEGGTWQRAWDPLGLSGPPSLAAIIDLLRPFNIRVAPYVVIRGRPEWRQAEFEQIRQCAQLAGMCILNLEPGDAYWNGATTPGGVQQWFNDLGVPPEKLWLCAIPRDWVAQALGGDQVMQVWTKNVAGCSWECYEDSPAPDLAPGVALPKVARWADTSNPWNVIPVIQRSMIDRYKDWPSPSIQVWTLDGN